MTLYIFFFSFRFVAIFCLVKKHPDLDLKTFSTEVVIFYVNQTVYKCIFYEWFSLSTEAATTIWWILLFDCLASWIVRKQF